MFILAIIMGPKRSRKEEKTMDIVDVINKVLSIVAPPLTFISFCLILLPFHLLKFVLSVVRSVFFVEDVSGKVVIITGASSGIGEQLAYEYARRRARLVLADIREKSLRKVAGMCLEIGSPDAVTVTADVSNAIDCKRVTDSAISHFGRLDHLVNNAGIITISMFEDFEDISKSRPVMDVNFWGSVYMTRFAIPHLRNTNGKIIAIASSASWLPVPRLSIYNASKAATVGFYETLRVEVGSDIHITIVTPGLIESEMTKGKSLNVDGQMIVDQNISDAILTILPVGKAEECAKCIVKSACRGERYVTVPAWCRVTYWWKAIFPELLDVILRLFFTPRPGHSANKSLGQMLADLPGLKKMLYPSSIRSSEIKTE